MKTLKIIFRCIIFMILTLLMSCEEKFESEPEPEPTLEDTTPPTISSVWPDDGATEISINTTITVEFSEPVIADTSSFYLTYVVDSSETWVEAEISTEENKVILTPTDSLQYGTKYIAYLSDKISDVAGNALEESREWSFTTILAPDLEPPRIVSISPKEDAEEVSVDTTITVEFSEPVIVDTSSFYLMEAEFSTLVGAKVSTEENKVTLTPTDSLQYGTEYIAHLSDEISDVAGNTLRESYEWSFTTELGPWQLPGKYKELNIGTNENDEIFMTGYFDETESLRYYFFAKFDNQGELIWLKDDIPCQVISNTRVPLMTVTNDFIYLGIWVASNWRIDKYTVNGEKVWSSQPDWSGTNRVKIIPAGDGNLYARSGQIVYKLSSEGQLISQVDCQRFYVSSMESTPYNYLLLWGDYEGENILAKLTYSDFEWTGNLSLSEPATHMRIDGNNLFFAGEQKVSKYELSENELSDKKWSVKYTDVPCIVRHTTFDRGGNLYILVTDYINFRWVKISPSGEVKATEIVASRDYVGGIYPTVMYIAATHNKVFVFVSPLVKWVFDLEAGTKVRIR